MQLSKWQESQKARQEAAAVLAASIPYLVRVDPTKRGDEMVCAAKNIRIELARTFPRIKFSVQGVRYSGGETINVRWCDGPSTAAVDAIIKKYSEVVGYEVDDSAVYNRSIWLDAFGSARFVSSSRSESGEAA